MDNCRKCGIELTKDNWFKSLENRGSKICKSCNFELNKQWKKNHHEKTNEYSLKYYRRNPGKHILACIKAEKKLRIDVIIAYGGKCCYCGITDFDVLTVDHIKNNGSIHRKSGMNSRPLYYFLKKNNYPKDDYQLLCRNCNWKKEIERKRKYSLPDI